MTTIELEPIADSITSPRDEYLRGVDLCLTAAGVTDDRQATTRLCENFYNFSPEFAQGTLRGAWLALEGANVLENMDMGLPVNRSLIVTSALLTDIGKEEIDDGVVATSLEGKTWSRALQEAIKPHSRLGGLMALRAGLPRVAPIVFTHHGAQEEPYGVRIPLDDEQLVARDVDTSEDVFEALFNRDNTRNRGMTKFEKMRFSYNHMNSYVFNNPFYQGRGPEIASAFLSRFMSVSPVPL